MSNESHAIIHKEHPMHGKLKPGDMVHMRGKVMEPEEGEEGHKVAIESVEKQKVEKKGKASPSSYLKNAQRKARGYPAPEEGEE